MYTFLGTIIALLLIISGPSSVALSCCLRAANIGKLRDTGDFVLHKHTVISAQPDPDTEQNCGPAYHHHETLPPIFRPRVAPCPHPQWVTLSRVPWCGDHCTMLGVTCHVSRNGSMRADMSPVKPPCSTHSTEALRSSNFRFPPWRRC